MEEETNGVEDTLDLLIQQNKQNFDELDANFDILIEQGRDNNTSLDNIFEQNEKVSKLLNQTIKEGIGNLHKVLTKLDSKEQTFLDTSPLVIELKSSSLKLDNLLKAVRSSEKLSGVLNAIKEEIEELEKFDFSKLSKITDKQTSDLLKGTYKANLDKYKKPEEALAVKFYDKDGELIEKFGGGGGGYPDVRLKNVAQEAINPATEEKQDAIITALGAVSIDTTGLATSANQTSGDQKTKVVDSAGTVQDWAKPEGQEASANSIGVVLSTEQEAILDGIDTQLTELKAEITPKATLLEVDSGDSTIKYIGKAFPGTATSAASWQIKRMTKSATGLVIDFADGSSVAGQVWDDRESLSYS